MEEVLSLRMEVGCALLSFSFTLVLPRHELDRSKLERWRRIAVLISKSPCS